MLRSSIALTFITALVGSPTISDATTWHVPSQCPTIQAGIDSASAGDTVLVACGTYHDCTHPDPWGNLYCIIMKSGVCLLGATGEADCGTIDAERQGQVVYCDGLDSTTTIKGLTVTGGSSGGVAGGMWCHACSLRIENCLFVENDAFHGGGIYSTESSLVIVDCTFSANAGWFGPGGLFFGESTPRLVGCTFVDNSEGGVTCSSSDIVFEDCAFIRNWRMDSGAALRTGSSSVTMTRCTFSGNVSGGAVVSCGTGSTIQMQICLLASNPAGAGAIHCGEDCIITMTCCDVHGNPGGDWVSCIADQYGVNGNFSEDPMFCDLESDDYHLQEFSPCIDGYGCGRIGAFGQDCSGSATRQSTWSSLKALYR